MLPSGVTSARSVPSASSAWSSDRNRVRASKPRPRSSPNGEYLKHLLWVLDSEPGGSPRPTLTEKSVSGSVIQNMFVS